MNVAKVMPQTPMRMAVLRPMDSKLEPTSGAAIKNAIGYPEKRIPTLSELRLGCSCFVYGGRKVETFKKSV